VFPLKYLAPQASSIVDLTDWISLNTHPYPSPNAVAIRDVNTGSPKYKYNLSYVIYKSGYFALIPSI